MITFPQSLTRQQRAWVGAALAVTLPVALAASGVTGALPGGVVHRGDAGWAGTSWMGDATSTTGTTLAEVKTAVGAASGTAATLTGTGIGIAVIDTGVANVPGLPASQIVNGPDLSFESQAPALRYQDTYGHGTHMAGIIVGNDTATGTVGLAPKAKVTSIKVGVSNGSVDVSQVLAAVDWVVKNRNHDPSYPIKVLNLSYTSGGTSGTGDVLHYALKGAWNRGITVVVSAGNSGTNATSLTNPANNPYLIAVGATTTRGTASTSDDELAPFTNLSQTGRQPDILAPGTAIASLRDPGSNIDQTYPTARVGETLFRGSGTSQAAAVTSASVALLLQKRPTLTPDQVKQAIVGSGTPITVGLGATKGLKQVNLAAALTKTTTTTAQSFALSTSQGSIEDSRGTHHVVHDSTALSGSRSIFGSFNSNTWGMRCAAQTSWDRGLWMGYRMAGDGFTGTSWASKTWAAATWAGRPWSSTSSSWTDPDWAGRYWAGRYWAGRYWAGQYWSQSEWATSTWG